LFIISYLVLPDDIQKDVTDPQIQKQIEQFLKSNSLPSETPKVIPIARDRTIRDLPLQLVDETTAKTRKPPNSFMAAQSIYGSTRTKGNPSSFLSPLTVERVPTTAETEIARLTNANEQLHQELTLLRDSHQQKLEGLLESALNNSKVKYKVYGFDKQRGGKQ
jgi:hypothetical protein